MASQLIHLHDTISEFGRRAAALDEAEQTAGERPGGPTAADSAAIRLLEARVHAAAPETPQDWRWAAQRLARALVNGWGPEVAAPLVGWCAG